MAKALLQEGADIDGMALAATHTAYWRAYGYGYEDDQWFLINKGANTRRMSEHGKPRDPQKQYGKARICTGNRKHEPVKSISYRKIRPRRYE